MLQVTPILTVTPTRDGAVEFGEKQNDGNMTPVGIYYELDDPQTINDGAGIRTVLTGKVCVPRTYPLAKGDWMTLPEGKFGVISDSVADFNHPMTGYDFGWKWFHIRLGG